MIKHALSLIALLAIAAPASAEVIALTPADGVSDGPYIEASAVTAEMTAPMTHTRVVAMSDIDGDLSNITPEEAEMIALLSQVLTVTPLEN